MSFKQELYKQLANTLKTTQPTRARTPRAKSANKSNNHNVVGKNRTPSKRVAANLNTDLSALDNSLCAIDNSSSFRVEKATREPIRRQQAYAERHFK